MFVNYEVSEIKAFATRMTQNILFEIKFKTDIKFIEELIYLDRTQNESYQILDFLRTDDIRQRVISQSIMEDYKATQFNYVSTSESFFQKLQEEVN